MGGKGGGDAPSPDPQIGEAAKMQAQTGADWLNFAKDAYKVSTGRQADLDAMTKQVQELELASATDQMKWSREDRQRYKDVFQKQEDKYIKQVDEMDSPAKLAAAAAEAKGDVQAEAAAAKGTAARNAQSLGINPTSGRYAGVEKAGELTTGLAAAGAANTAREGQRDKALALRGGIMDFGRGYTTSSVAASQAGVNAGNAAVQQGQGNQQLSNASTEIMGAGFQGAQSGYQGQGTTLSNLYGLNLDKWRTQQETAAANVSGIAGAIGSGIGMFAAMSDPKAKKNVKAVKKGKSLEAVKKLPVNKFDYKPGMGDGGKNHVGPMADKFAKATGQPDNGMIKFQDAIGLTIAAIQDLDAKVEKLGISKGGKAKGKSGKPAERRPSQSPAKARMTTAKPAVKAQAYGIRRA